jgi:hypothetical protein
MRWRLCAVSRGKGMLTFDFKEFAELLNSNGVEGVQFAQCYARRASILIDGVSLDFISLEDFKTNKKAVGRHKDLADLEALEPPKPSKKQD